MSGAKKYCADLQGGMWLQFNTVKKQWMAKPCCLYKTEYPIIDNLNRDFWQHPTIQKERQENLQGKDLPDNCKVCQVTERNNNYSRRQSWNDRLGTNWENPNSVIELDIQADFSCNLACLICGPQFSTYWRHVLSDEKHKESKQFKIRAGNNNAIELLNTIPLHDIRQIHFQGGEPLLSNTHVEILERLQDNVDLRQVTIWYHSNSTVRVSEKILKFWEKFKMVEIYFSLDDMGPRMEYQRWPCVWQEMSENLQWFRINIPHNTLLNVERSVGILNAAWILELDQWHKENFTKTIHGDDISLQYHDCFGIYSMSALSQEYKNYVIENTPAAHWLYKQIFNAPTDDETSIRKMLNHLNQNDAIRNNDWKKIYPEFLEWYSRYF